jgi:hypothetical protein
MAEWTRITYLLPITTRNDRTAYLRTLNLLRTKYPQISGFTYSQDDPPTLHGYYWSETLTEWIHDIIAMVAIDRHTPSGASEILKEEIRLLKREVERIYWAFPLYKIGLCSCGFPGHLL